MKKVLLERFRIVSAIVLIVGFFVSCGTATRLNVSELSPSEKNKLLKEYQEEAHSAFKKKDYKAAIRYYGLALEINPNDEYLYYNRGAAYYNREKYKEAISDFQRCVNVQNCNKDIKVKAKKLIEDANKLHEEKIQRRSTVIGGIMLAVLGVTVGVLSGNLYDNSDSYNTQNSTYSNTMNQQQLNQLLDPRQAMMQVEAQNRAEYNQFCRYNKKSDGSNYTYEEWQMIKAASMQDSNAAVNSSSTKSEGTSSVRHEREGNKYGYKPCHMCKGTGICSTCDGKGWYTGVAGKVLCPNCDSNHNGVCNHCHGTKQTYDLIY